MSAMLDFNTDAIRAAKAALDIHNSLQVTLVPTFKGICSYPEFTCGLYQTRDAIAHQVYVRTRDIHRASESLWHELMHVHQCEMYHGGSFTRFHAEFVRQLEEGGADSESRRRLTQQQWEKRYYKCPYEADALHFSAMMVGPEYTDDVPALLREAELFSPTTVVHYVFID